ncbi:hypothetical protein [Luteitalea pratensis]|nr:hypothetical protein [Luteitalea pratensis]
MSDATSPLAPGPGDYVVLYQRQRLSGNSRLALIRLSDNATQRVIRVTFESVVEAGPRFEDEARLMAAASSTRGYRCVDGLYTPLDATVDDHDV